MKTATQLTHILFSLLLILMAPGLMGLGSFAKVQNNPNNSSILRIEDLNAAPDLPALVSPADGASGVSVSPTLEVSVSDPDVDNLTVTFYGRTYRPDFTLVAMGDTKKYTFPPALALGIFDIQNQWIVDNQASLNIPFVSHMGDLVLAVEDPSQWAVVNSGLGKLETAGIPFGIGIGNTDENNMGFPPYSNTYFNSHFPVSRFLGRPYYGGAYNGDSSNSYQLFTAGGMDFIVINLQFNIAYYGNHALAILGWADTLLKNNSNRRAIVINHFLLDTANNFSSDGALIYDKLKGNPNLFLMMGDHYDTEGQRQNPGKDGHPIYSLRSTYQTRPNGGDGWMRLLTFSPATNQINVKTYSPYLNQYETDADSQFSLDYDMGGDFQVVGTATVPSGSNASVSWPNLAPDEQYQWYLTVDDGTSITTGPTWGFTTETVPSAPVITFQPGSQTVTAGNTAIFTVAAEGIPEPTVQWQISADGIIWNNIPGATSNTYYFTVLTTDANKRFRAVFTNENGSATTIAALLTVNTIPAVTLQPVDQTVIDGQTATFTAAANGNPAPIVRWQTTTDGITWTDIPGATATTYSFNAFLADDGEQYRAYFGNIAGAVTTNAVILTVNSVPSITLQPFSQTVNEGQLASFMAGASGKPTPTVQWQVSNNGTNWTDIPGATSTTYSFTAQPADNGKQYRTIFTNITGSATTNAASLTVNYAPIITTHPAGQTINAGEAATFTAAATGNPSPTVQWQVSPNGTNWNNIPGATSTTYSVIVQSVDNGKQYRAVFTNLRGSTNTNAAALTVHYAPTVTTQPANQAVIVGETASFTTAASGNPVPSVQWQVTTNGTDWSDITGATSTTYSFATQLADDGKQFRAVFTNFLGTTNTNAAVLAVNYAPTVTTQPASQIVNEGQLASFTAGASGKPTPTVQWQVSTNGTDWSHIPGATSTTYGFMAQSADDGKQYRAVFTNVAGTATSSAASLVVNTAPVVLIHPANNTASLGETVSFTSAASGKPTPTVQWQVSGDGVFWSDITGATSTTYSFSVAFEDNGKQYRAVFTNALGSANSNAATLKIDNLIFLPLVLR